MCPTLVCVVAITLVLEVTSQLGFRAPPQLEGSQTPTPTQSGVKRKLWSHHEAVLQYLTDLRCITAPVCSADLDLGAEQLVNSGSWYDQVSKAVRCEADGDFLKVTEVYLKYTLCNAPLASLRPLSDSLKKINVGTSTITGDLKDIREMDHLTTFSNWDNLNIGGDLSSLAGALPKMTVLIVHTSNVTGDIKHIKHKKLNTLMAGYTGVYGDVAHLRDMPLQQIIMQYSGVYGSLSTFRNAPAVFLNLEGTQVTGDLADLNCVAPWRRALRFIQIAETKIGGNLDSLAGCSFQIFDAGNTEIEGSLSVFANNPVQLLSLPGTNIYGTIDSISRLNLSVMDLSETQVSGNLLSLVRMSTLRSLYLDNVAVLGSLYDIPQGLQLLSLQGIGLTGDISALSIVKNLTYAQLNGNALTGQMTNRFSPMLTYLDASENFLHKDDEDSVQIEASNLSYLSLRANGIFGKSLREVRLKSTGIVDLTANAFECPYPFPLSDPTISVISDPCRTDYSFLIGVISFAIAVLVLHPAAKYWLTKRATTAYPILNNCDRVEAHPAHTCAEGEGPIQVLEATGSYVNALGAKSGLIVRPAIGPTTVSKMSLTSAHNHTEHPGSAPATVQVEGSNDECIWVPISRNMVGHFSDNSETMFIDLCKNSKAYSVYRITFPDLVDPTAILQIGCLQLYGRRAQGLVRAVSGWLDKTFPCRVRVIAFTLVILVLEGVDVGTDVYGGSLMLKSTQKEVFLVDGKEVDVCSYFNYFRNSKGTLRPSRFQEREDFLRFNSYDPNPSNVFDKGLDYTFKQFIQESQIGRWSRLHYRESFKQTCESFSDCRFADDECVYQESKKSFILAVIILLAVLLTKEFWKLCVILYHVILQKPVLGKSRHICVRSAFMFLVGFGPEPLLDILAYQPDHLDLVLVLFYDILLEDIPQFTLQMVYVFAITSRGISYAEQLNIVVTFISIIIAVIHLAEAIIWPPVNEVGENGLHSIAGWLEADSGNRDSAVTQDSFNMSMGKVLIKEYGDRSHQNDYNSNDNVCCRQDAYALT